VAARANELGSAIPEQRSGALSYARWIAQSGEADRTAPALVDRDPRDCQRIAGQMGITGAME